MQPSNTPWQKASSLTPITNGTRLSLAWIIRWINRVIITLQRLDFLAFDLDCYEGDDPVVAGLQQMVHEFHHYIDVNRSYIPNYGGRYRYGETISTAFVESTVNEVVSRRMVKKQQMRWTKQGAHLLLQVRVRTLNAELREVFWDWYPGMKESVEGLPLAV